LAIAGGAEVEAVRGIEFRAGEAGGLEHGGGDVDEGRVGKGEDFGLDEGVGFGDGIAEVEAGGAEFDGEKGPGEGGVEMGDFVGEGEEAVVEEFGGVAVAEVVVAGIDEKGVRLGEGDELIEKVDAGGEGGSAEAEVEGAGVGEIGGEGGPEANGGGAVEGYGAGGEGALVQALGEFGDFGAIPIH